MLSCLAVVAGTIGQCVHTHLCEDLFWLTLTLLGPVVLLITKDQSLYCKFSFVMFCLAVHNEWKSMQCPNKYSYRFVCMCVCVSSAAVPISVGLYNMTFNVDLHIHHLLSSSHVPPDFLWLRITLCFKILVQIMSVYQEILHDVFL